MVGGWVACFEQVGDIGRQLTLMSIARGKERREEEEDMQLEGKRDVRYGILLSTISSVFKRDENVASVVGYEMRECSSRCILSGRRVSI